MRKPAIQSSAVEQTLLEMAQAVSAGDYEGWCRLWHRDARKFAPNAPAVSGRANLLYCARSWLRDWSHNMNVECDEVQIADQWAFASGSLTLRSVSVAGEDARFLSAKFLAVLVRERQGPWQIFRYSYNSDVPLPAER
jgi:ketosteroid isomerase-like protein